mgnify:CR=1 FL=1
MYLYLYRMITYIVLFASPIILIIRFLKKKEDINRFKEKFSIISKDRKKGKVIWFHGASVGEITSVIPLIEKLEKRQDIKQILITSSTLSSSKIIKKTKFKKVIHQFYPLDINFITQNFLNHWKPNLAIFIDSEIWPNMLINLKKRSVKSLLLNARITKKTFSRWKLVDNFAKEILSNFEFILVSNNETKKYLNYFGVKKNFSLGNIKYTEAIQKVEKLNYNLIKFLKSKVYWCASSTHPGEEEICLNVHLKLTKNIKNLITIIIPRHTERKPEIINLINEKKLNYHCHSWDKMIKNNTSIYLVDTYGETKKFFKIVENVFLGGSLIKHGGQNPLEPARYGSKIIHGPNVDNFKEIFNTLSKLNISKKVNNQQQMIDFLKKSIGRKPISKRYVRKINKLGKNILLITYKKIEKLI